MSSVEKERKAQRLSKQCIATCFTTVTIPKKCHYHYRCTYPNCTNTDTRRGDSENGETLFEKTLVEQSVKERLELFCSNSL